MRFSVTKECLYCGYLVTESFDYIPAYKWCRRCYLGYMDMFIRVRP